MKKVKSLIYDTYFSNKNEWHSWDDTPWLHPWLTDENLEKFKCFSTALRKRNLDFLDHIQNKNAYRFAFLGNIGNCLYTRMAPLRTKNIVCDIYLRPEENYVMSHPAWEEVDLTVDSAEEVDFHHLTKIGKLKAGVVPGFYQLPLIDMSDISHIRQEFSLGVVEYQQHKSCIPLFSTVAELKKYDAIIATGAPYLARLAKKPYATVSFGGDLWYEASRGDMLGLLQREGFGKSKVLLTSDPLTLAHCRRFNLNNAMYIPHYLDEKKYSPGPSEYREHWQKQVGGNFFMLASARLDKSVKGSDRAMDAAIRFMHKYDDARLVVVGWGANKEELYNYLEKAQVLSKVIFLPISSKIRLVSYLRASDCFLGQFILGAYGHADLEAFACGLPVIGYIENKYYDKLCNTGAPPVLNAKTSDEIFNQLTRLRNEEERKFLAEQSRCWFLKNHGSEACYIEHFAVLAAMSNNLDFNYTTSPLSQKLSRKEKEYHASQLKIAPNFPNYA